ncbi:hypothetical protein JW948_01575 [bacterium]|nr:hypothetical protein [bacterium]
MNAYRTISLLMLTVFALVGLTFLFATDGVLSFFNAIAARAGMKQSPVPGTNFYVILTGGYMYLVSMLALMMFRHPENPVFPFLLAHAKLASSILSLGFFLLHETYLIYIANCVVDGFIGLLVLVLHGRIRKNRR